MGMAMPRPDAKVAVKSEGRLVADGARARPSALAEHDRDRGLEIEISDAEPGEFPDAHPRIYEKPQNRSVAALDEAGPRTRLEQAPKLVPIEHGDRNLGNLNRTPARSGSR
jgi:hypothetical protein